MAADLESVCQLLTEHAPKLREAGVLELEVGDIRVKLADPDPPDLEDEDEDEPSVADPMQDGETYGRRTPPGYERRQRGGES